MAKPWHLDVWSNTNLNGDVKIFLDEINISIIKSDYYLQDRWALSNQLKATGEKQKKSHKEEGILPPLCRNTPSHGSQACQPTMQILYFSASTITQTNFIK